MSVFPAAFARLGKRPSVRVAAAEDDDKKKDDEKAKAVEKDEDDKKDDEDDDKKSSKAQGDDDDENDAKAEKDDEDEDEDKKDDEKSKAHAPRAARGDDDAGDRADALDPQASTIRMRERGRIHAILSSDVAQANPGAAVFMAMKTQMSRNDAIGTLMASSGAVKPAAAALHDRMRSVEIPAVGASDVSRGAPTLAEQIILSGKKRRGEV